MSLVEDELISIANAAKDSISLWASARNVSMSIKNIILPPAPNATNGNSAMALAEVQFSYDYRYSDQKKIITVVIVLETLESHSSDKRVGTFKFERDLPCNLSKLMINYLLPPPIYHKGKIYEYSRCVHPIPTHKLPCVSELHRYVKIKYYT